MTNIDKNDDILKRRTLNQLILNGNVKCNNQTCIKVQQQSKLKLKVLNTNYCG